MSRSKCNNTEINKVTLVLHGNVANVTMQTICYYLVMVKVWSITHQNTT